MGTLKTKIYGRMTFDVPLEWSTRCRVKFQRFKFASSKTLGVKAVDGKRGNIPSDAESMGNRADC